MNPENSKNLKIILNGNHRLVKHCISNKKDSGEINACALKQF